MTARKKPDLSIDTSGWLSPTVLSDRERYNLSLKLKSSGVPAETQERLLDFANTYMQMRGECDDPVAKQVEELRKVADSTRRVLAALGALNKPARSTLMAHMREGVRFGELEICPAVAGRMTAPDEPVFLDDAWEYINALHVAAEYAISQQEPSRQDKPKQIQARALVANLAAFYFRETGNAPPEDPAGWFAEFAATLGDRLGLKVGERIVKSGIRLVTHPESEDAAA